MKALENRLRRLEIKSGVEPPQMMYVVEAQDGTVDEAVGEFLRAESIERRPRDLVVVLRRFDEDEELRLVSVRRIQQPRLRAYR